MFSQYFGSFLLDRQLLTVEQLKEVLRHVGSARVMLGVSAINAGLMTPEQVERVHCKQKQTDMKFGKLAVESGYLSPEGLEYLLSMQKKDHLLLAQAVIDKKFMTLQELEMAFHLYREENDLTQAQFNSLQQGDTDEIVRMLLRFDNGAMQKKYQEYVSLFIRNIIRFVDKDVLFEKEQDVSGCRVQRLISQEIKGEVNLHTGIALDEPDLLKIGGRYAGRAFDRPDCGAEDALAEFLNLQNGIFLVNMSDRGTELQLRPQKVSSGAALTRISDGYAVPFSLPFCRFTLVLSGEALG